MIDALCDRGNTPYREIGRRAVSFVMDRCGITYTQDDVRRLLQRPDERVREPGEPVERHRERNGQHLRPLKRAGS